ncbi:GNAT family N-acetyltransferase [Paracoccus sp. 1_MG-2023]|uniref:GNAT family N-acetyltransferase n=1 Tax=unclassified Paracoccus (in: a-proteobacteria) TaxID=2688777 RepID=UPI001C09454C|nr:MULTISPECIES: GNAT family N-acetyltransferase [unclassified Paracoccus (in: a-proteobacteria)]MBU2958125.1 GNAT family N-acetyltransferase [Paracoccus sp. C2R09]MDO6669289.1 GNAT family N-acetyltransferase [Paracoccus sp. 1_MG-2023]
MNITIASEDPRHPDLDLLFHRHAEAMQADTPPESMHMLPRAELVSDRIGFFVLRIDGRPCAMGALKDLGDGLGELKSMHVLSEDRGRGLSRQMLAHLMKTARAQGLTHLSLETGAQASFAAARGLYSRAGFAECPPFGSYRPDPNSVFMTMAI